MEFDIEEKSLKNAERYDEDELDLAYEFATKIHEELESFIKALVLFGSVARKRSRRKFSGDGEGVEGKIQAEDSEGDIDILLIVDDVSLELTRELVQTYRLIVERTIRDVSTRLHVITLKFTSFWEYVRSGDPVAVNVLRDGVPIIDTGFFEPLQVLLSQGRIRPTPESVWSYFKKAPMSLKSSENHITQAVLDLYWAVIDSAHAALMKVGEIPPSPEHASEMLRKKLVKPGVIEPKYADVMEKFYNLMKDVTRGEKKEMRGERYDELYDEAKDFVKEMKDFLEQ